MNCLIVLVSCLVATEAARAQCPNGPTGPCGKAVSEPQTNITAAFTPVKLEQIDMNLTLTCQPGSFFKTLTFSGQFDFGATCTRLFAGLIPDDQGFYVGHKWDGTSQAVNGDYRWIASFNTGSLQFRENANLTNSWCAGDQLFSMSSYTAEDPFTGCCGSQGVSHLNGRVYDLKIYGKCCSTCSIQSASIQYPQAVSNSA